MSDDTNLMKMTKLLWIPLAIVAVCCVAILLTVDDWSRDWTTNHAKIEVTVVGTEQEIANRIRQWSETNGAWTLIKTTETDQAKLTIELTRTSMVLRFVDDISVTLTRNGDLKCDVVAESRSRIGKGDLGQNPRNLAQLRSAIEAK